MTIQPGGQSGASHGAVLPGSLLLALLFAWLLVADAAHAAVQVGPIQVTALNGYTGSEPTRHGYREYRIALENFSDAPVRVTLEMPDTGGTSRPHIARIRRQITVAPETRTTVSLFQPPLAGVPLVQINANRQSRVLNPGGPQHEPRMRWHRNPQPISILQSQGVDPRTQSRLEKVATNQVVIYRANLPLEQWSDAGWLSFSAFDMVLMTGEEFGRMRPGVREHLRRYLTVGGTLAVVGEVNWPDAWQSARGQHELRDDWAWGNEPAERFALGFGQVFRLPAKEPGLIHGEIGPLIDAAARTAEPFRNPLSVHQANNHLPVIEDLGIPRRGMLGLMVAFALVIGPINLLVLHRLKRQMWLLGTVPTIALIFCLAVWGYAVASEGFTGRERSATVTYLDQPNQVAASIGWVGFYAPLTPGGGLTFDVQTELTPQIHQGNDQRGRTVIWGDQQQLSNGWIVARVPAHFQLRKADDALLRLAVQRQAGGTLAVTNGLGADIRSLTLMDHAGRLYTLDNLEAGARAEPVRIDAPPNTASRALRDLYANDWLDGLDNLQRSPAAFLRPGTYIAVIDDEPFVKSGLNQADRRETETVVYGVFARPSGQTQPGDDTGGDE